MVNKVKKAMIRNNGAKCMICGKKVGALIELHHIIPKFFFKQNYMPIDSSYANTGLVCHSCHSKIHSYEYGTSKYERLMKIIRRNKR